jgi:hypothetical protein
VVDLQLSEHFRLSEFLRSETAARLGIDNTPSEEIVEALRRNAANMEGVRIVLGVPIHISSGYRCLALNRALKSKDTSAHVDGRATDFDAPAFGSPLAVCRQIEDSPIHFDQLIYEHTWAHIAWARYGEMPRRQVLTLMKDGSYSHGLVPV